MLSPLTPGAATASRRRGHRLLVQVVTSRPHCPKDGEVVMSNRTIGAIGPSAKSLSLNRWGSDPARTSRPLRQAVPIHLETMDPEPPPSSDPERGFMLAC